MDKEMEQMLTAARRFNLKLRKKMPPDGFAKDYIIAVRCILDALIESIEEEIEEAEGDADSS